jgi:hypothetical protein
MGSAPKTADGSHGHFTRAHQPPGPATRRSARTIAFSRESRQWEESTQFRLRVPRSAIGLGKQASSNRARRPESVNSRLELIHTQAPLSVLPGSARLEQYLDAHPGSDAVVWRPVRSRHWPPAIPDRCRNQTSSPRQTPAIQGHERAPAVGQNGMVMMVQRGICLGREYRILRISPTVGNFSERVR